MLVRVLILFFLSLSNTPLLAGDIARDIRQGGSPRDGGYLELGLAVYYLESQLIGFEEGGAYSRGLGLVVDGRYQWRRLFVEAITENERGLTFGVSLVDEDAWSLDILASSQHSEVSEDIDDELDGLADREDDFMLGLRTTLSFENTIAEFELATDVSGTHDGSIAGVSLGRFWQIRNLNLHSQIGFRLSSKQIADYYVGIDPSRDTISERFPAYSVNSAVEEYKLEVGATYPINENWVFRSTLQSFLFSREIKDSPLATNNNGHLVWLTSVSRVF